MLALNLKGEMEKICKTDETNECTCGRLYANISEWMKTPANHQRYLYLILWKMIYSQEPASFDSFQQFSLREWEEILKELHEMNADHAFMGKQHTLVFRGGNDAWFHQRLRFKPHHHHHHLSFKIQFLKQANWDITVLFFVCLFVYLWIISVSVCFCNHLSDHQFPISLLSFHSFTFSSQFVVFNQPAVVQLNPRCIN